MLFPEIGHKVRMFMADLAAPRYADELCTI